MVWHITFHSVVLCRIHQEWGLCPVHKEDNACPVHAFVNTNLKEKIRKLSKFYLIERKLYKDRSRCSCNCKDEHAL